MGNRPMGITILGILHILAGISIAIGGIIGAMIAGAFTATMSQYDTFSGPLSILGGAIAAIIIAAAAFHFIIAFGLFSAKWWGRLLVIILTVIALIFDGLSILAGNFFVIIFVIIDVIVLYYMWRPNVIAYFEGRTISANNENDPLDVLKKRLANGEITQEEYEQLKKKLE